MKKLSILFLFAILAIACTKKKETKTTSNELTAAEKVDATIIKEIFDTALLNGKSHEWLRDLTTNVGGRLSGSPEAAMAVKWGEHVMKEAGLDSVWLQPAMVPHWIRGEKEVAYYISDGKKFDMAVCALGGSISTPRDGVMAEVIEVKSIKEAEALGAIAKGKIIFFNRPFDNTLINTFSAYGGSVDQRGSGAKTVGKFGALAVIVRSMTNNIDNYPHTGTMRYGDIPESEYIPAAAISTLAAENLSKSLKENPNLKVYLKQSSKNLPKEKSFNVIGEIRGSENPEKVIVVGGHLDSWDLGDGAHDDGTGIVQSLEVLHLFKTNKIKPKNTIRVVFFMDEEQGGSGSKAYAKNVKTTKEIHIGGVESDSGGFTPRGFTIDANSANTDLLKSWKKLLAPYGLHDINKGGSGADVGKLKSEGVTLVGYRPDSQRYFDYHHAATDTFDKVNKRELELGSASMASMIYLMDKYLYNNAPN
ncbi:Bacterial leucyl aminopeptidase [Polaribacter huanghezhanensis]|uniref:M20/M25/M40 family metallo-hydrolase n=1 Tax=Polaribacter huanghezhanensis TaxID=1354726 RepID=UPI00264A172C|nr:M20/M25/M40 family metallo-hydrolase [Polaribacter huanghezhanensis]WKD84936.1 Bacterial leucyl aminopeptidase [Polaribacter huanghezhanensis]